MLAVAGSRELVTAAGAVYRVAGHTPVRIAFGPEPHVLEGLDTLERVAGAGALAIVGALPAPSSESGTSARVSRARGGSRP